VIGQAQPIITKSIDTTANTVMLATTTNPRTPPLPQATYYLIESLSHTHLIHTHTRTHTLSLFLSFSPPRPPLPPPPPASSWRGRRAGPTPKRAGGTPARGPAGAVCV
jgi:hypothetical protein